MTRKPKTTADVKRLRAEVRRLRRVIRTPKFTGMFAECRYCSACAYFADGTKPSKRKLDHEPDCVARAALARRKGKP